VKLELAGLRLVFLGPDPFAERVPARAAKP